MRDCKNCIHYKPCKSLYDSVSEYCGWPEEMDNAADDCEDFTEENRGHWHGYTTSQFMGFDDYGDPKYRDGVIYTHRTCGFNSIIKHKYCPRCGARMDGDDHDD